MRIVLDIEYDGMRFSGWQKQQDRRTVQLSVEHALSIVADQPVGTACAGRTDSGVHALEQVVHFDTTAERRLESWVAGTNTYLPDDVRVLWARLCCHGFHARHSAIARYYRYVILNRPTHPAILRGRATWCYLPLEIGLMSEAAEYLVGEHDFSSFRAQHCQSRSPFRCVYYITVKSKKDKVIVDIVANAFLHHMVRNIVGVLMDIGAGKKKPSWAREVLLAGDRKAGGTTARADGLYLKAVCYPENFEIFRHSIFDCLPETVRRFKRRKDHE